MAKEEKTAAERLVAGMAIILKREPKTNIDIHDDVLFAGNAESSVYTTADKSELDALGWYSEEESWAFAT